jgi:hypothetical protein
MKSQFESQCGKKELLVAYLYEEATQAERAAFEQHQLSCAGCRNELQAFKGVRQELSAWEMPFVPHIEVVTPRTAVDALRDFFRLVSAWFKVTSGLAATAAAVLVVFALAGTHISVSQGGVDVKFGVKEVSQMATGSNDSPQPMRVNSLSRDEAEQMIQAAVAHAQSQAQEQTRLQLASLEARLKAAHQLELQNATMRLRQDQQKQLSAELAKLDSNQRQTLTEWLLTATDASETQVGASNEKNQ